jgi:hypothetical protein
LHFAVLERRGNATSAIINSKSQQIREAHLAGDEIGALRYN